jgi:hypothetical protein
MHFATVTAASAPPHVVVDTIPTDPLSVAVVVVSVVTLLAVFYQIWLARRTLVATNDELKLSNAQLAEAQKASEQTRQALALTQQQIELSRQDAVAAVRRAAPRVVAEIRDETIDGVPRRSLVVTNKGGGTASYVTVSGLTPKFGGGLEMHPTAGNVVQALAAGEVRYSKIDLAYPAGSYAQKVRIRYFDASGYKYITEYRSINEDLAFPMFREPWLGEQFGFPRPERCSDRVTWAVEHYERYPGFLDEPVDEMREAEAEAVEQPTVLELLGGDEHQAR